MEVQMTKKRAFWEIYGPDGGCEWVDAADAPPSVVAMPRIWGNAVPIPEPLRSYVEQDTAWEIKLIHGYGIRLSMPGYLDCTPWTVYTSLREAEKAVADERRSLAE